MKKIKEFMNKIPSWAVMLVLFAVLYFTGWHKDIISQVQKVVLLSGLMDADVPEVISESETDSYKVGTGFSMKNMDDGQAVLFDQFHGKAVFLNLWASWCPPCKAEMPSIQALYEDLEGKGIEFVMLSLDADTQKAKDYIADNNYTFPVYFPLGKLPGEFQARAIPTTYIVSPNGKIVFSHSGIANYDTDQMKDFLRGMKR